MSITLDGAAIIATIALIQPWAINLFNYLFKKGRLEIHETGKIELGYSDYGPTVNLAGTLRPKNRDIFIVSMEVEITRLRDNATHKFKWFAFKDNAISITEPQAKIAIATGFITPLNSPKEFNVFFASGTFQEETNNFIQPFKNKWTELVSAHIKSLPQDHQAPNAASINSAQEELFSQITKTQEAQNLYNTLTDLFFWTPGSYNLKLIANTVEAKKKEESWQFSIDSDESQKIKANAAAIMRQSCRLPQTYNFLYKTYKKANHT
ncbi:hypothetical protein [Chromobacterium subtsugae]|uniref:hypothetical protein n=1 Tax=Chromobacterium subtsugae TaxID=251747 RepID=UPI000B083E4C|nr:hypothetical protein [Chromobacterium subtsugae]